MVNLKYISYIKLKWLNLSAWYITGLPDREGSFQITIQDIKGQGLKGLNPFLQFKITQKKLFNWFIIKSKRIF